MTERARTGPFLEAEMLDELKTIDVSAIEDLRSIKKEEETLQKRMEKMEAKREGVSEVVFERVLADYTTRIEELETNARPLKEQARREYGKLKALLDTMSAKLEEARLAQEELTFRHDLGEFTEKDFKSRLEECHELVGKSEAELKEGEELKARFLGAFHSEEDLEDAGQGPVGESTSAHEKSVVEEEPPGVTADLAVDESEVGTSGAPEQEEPFSPQEEPVVPDEKPAVAASPAKAREQDATALLNLPKLITEAPDGAEQVHPLAMGTTTIGRLVENDLCIPDGTVSRYHARIEMADDGFRIIDQNSDNGVFVNGERVSEQLLEDGDRVQIGPGTKVFIFRFGASE